MKKEYKVYEHIAPNKKVYIGVTSMNPKNRWNKGKGYKGNEIFFKDIELYGWDNIEHKIIDTFETEREAHQLEIKLIKDNDSMNSLKGYNLYGGGISNLHGISEDTKKKIKDLDDFQKPLYREYTNEEIKSIENKYYNRLLKTKVKKTSSHSKVKKSTKPTYDMYSREGEFIKSYTTLQGILKEMNISPQDVKKCISGQKKTSGGYVFVMSNNKDSYDWDSLKSPTFKWADIFK